MKYSHLSTVLLEYQTKLLQKLLNLEFTVQSFFYVLLHIKHWKTVFVFMFPSKNSLILQNKYVTVSTNFSIRLIENAELSLFVDDIQKNIFVLIVWLKLILQNGMTNHLAVSWFHILLLWAKQNHFFKETI